MTAITLRAGKGSPLTMTEMDDNFNNLNTAKVETSAVGTAAAEDVMYFDRLLATYSSITNAAQTIKIKLPAALGPTQGGAMLRFRIDVYSSYNMESYICGGYLYNTPDNWYLPIVRYEAVGNSAAMTPSAMTFGMDGTNPYVSLTVGGHAGVAVRGQTQGFTNAATNYLIDGWSITEDATTPNPVTPQIITSWNSQNFQPASKLSASANLSDVASVPVSRANLGLGTAATATAQTSTTDATPGRVMQVGAFGIGLPHTSLDNLDCNSIDPDVQFIGVADGNSLNGPPGLGYFYIQQFTYTGGNRTQIAVPYKTSKDDLSPMWFRGYFDTSGWSPWQQLWDSANFDPTTKLDKASNLSDLANITTALINLGLNQVNNTSDVNKPVSTAQQTALDLKAALSGGAAANFAAMPQVGGSPIVESGSNANGTWIKFADGTMICRQFKLNLSQGWQSGSTITYPATFIDNQASVVGHAIASDSSGYSTVFSIFNTGATASNPANFNVFRYTVGFTDSGTTLMLGYIAIGRWE